MEDTPKQLGDFEILRELGRGGMGVVYEARQKSLNRRVALKVLSTGLGLTTKAIMRFKREAEAAAKLHHTNIVPIYSTGEDGRIPFYAMELVDGPSLDQVIRQLRSGSDMVSKGSLDSTDDASPDQQNSVPDWVAGTIGLAMPSAGSDGATSTPFNPSDGFSSFGPGNTYFDNVASMMSEVADALAHAHDQGVIHRDIKPSNLLLSADGRLSVNDFGLARMLEQPGMTISGELMGSPMYMSPEQIAVGRIPLDHRTDIYSLGSALYELLTLQTPFAGRQRDQVLSQIIHKEPSPPRTINQRIPKDLETICLKAMEKDPDRRYQTADLMAEDLRRVVNRHAISARRIGLVERAGRWARKNKAVTAMACLTLIVIVGAASFLHVSQRNQDRKEFMRKALTAAMSGKPDDAAKYMNEAKTYGATESWSKMIEGQVHRFRGEVADALEDLEIAVDLDDGNLTAQYMLAEAYHANGDARKHEGKIRDLSTRAVKKPVDKLFKGQAIFIFSFDEAIREMGEAIDELPGFHLARLMRANARVFRGMDQNDAEPILLALNEIDSVSIITMGEENPFLNYQRLHARLAAYHVFQNKGEPDNAKMHLAEAASDAKTLASSKSFLYGNLARMIYFDLNSNLDGVEAVMRDALASNNKGLIVGPYVTALYRAGKYEQALERLMSMPDGDDPFLIRSRAFLLMETLEGRYEAEKICRKSLEQGESGRMIIDCLFLLGKEDDAMDQARRLYDAAEPSEYWPLARELMAYRAGLIGEEELVELAGNSERDKAETYWIIGLRKLAQGDRQGAQANFNKIASSPIYVWSSVMWARAFAERIDKDPNWPDWLSSEPVEGQPK